MTDPDEDQTPAEVRILYTGSEPLRVNLRDGRAAVFSLEDPERTLPAGSAHDLLSAAIGGRRFIRLSRGGV